MTRWWYGDAAVTDAAAVPADRQQHLEGEADFLSVVENPCAQKDTTMSTLHY